MTTKTPEQITRELIDAKLKESGWIVQNRSEINLYAGDGEAKGVAVREFRLKTGYADYLLFVDAQAVGVIEAKKKGFTLGGVTVQAHQYSEGLPDTLDAPCRPLPFCYVSTGELTRFTNQLDPKPRSREIFQFHRPETLKEWLDADTLDHWVKKLHSEGGFYTAADDTKPSSLRSRLSTLPPLEDKRLFQNVVRGVTNLEISLKDNHPRSLVQMATGSGKTMLAVSAVYRLIKFAGARRVLFLVDRGNLGEQAEKEFQNFRTPDDNRIFTELYNVQRLTSGNIGSSSKVVISTIQRMYSMLKGEEFDPETEEESMFEKEPAVAKEPLPVVYCKDIPPEHFDVIIVDECHRSIYTLWRQVLDYFDCFLIGLTATPAKHTLGFFKRNLVMEYRHEQAVADNVNVDFEIYRIRTRITENGSTIEAETNGHIGLRDRTTRKVRWQTPDETVTYEGKDLDRAVVAEDQIRTIIQAFKEKLHTELFPMRKYIPKTLIFAKDDSHAEDITRIAREVFGEGDEFCQKITYRTTGAKPSDLIQAFRNEFNPRIAVTVDMIATGTDIKPIEVVVFMRAVKSRVLFEQMKGRGVRIINPEEFKSVTPDGFRKTKFFLIDCIGITDEDKFQDTQPLERKKTVPFKSLMETVAAGSTDPDVMSSLASRLARLDKQCDDTQKAQIQKKAPEQVTLSDISRNIVNALNPDNHIAKAREDNALPESVDPSSEQLKAAEKTLLREAAKPLASNPELREVILTVRRAIDQIIDILSIDEVIEAGFSEDARTRALKLIDSFQSFLEENKDELDALQFFYSQPFKRRLRFKDIKAIHDAIKAPPRSWTKEELWTANETIARNQVKGAGGQRRLTDIVSLIKFTLKQDDELEPYADKVNRKFSDWLLGQETMGRGFTGEQKQWLEMIRDHVAGSLEITVDDFSYTPFVEEGGLGKAMQVFGKELRTIIEELNEVLVA